MSKAKCPECKSLNEIQVNSGGFYFDTVEYRCSCGYVLICMELTFTMAMKMLKNNLKKDKRNSN